MVRTQIPGAKVWTKDEILALIDRCVIPGQEDGKTIYRMLRALYGRQTATEQASHASQEHNGLGFTKFDAKLLSDIAQHAENYRSLTPKQTQLVGRRLRKYHRQLVEIANENEAAMTARSTQPSVSSVGCPRAAPNFSPTEPRMIALLERKSQLSLETPYLIGRRPMVVHVEPWGLRLREKGCSHALEITWAQIHNRAALIASDKAREARKARRKES